MDSEWAQPTGCLLENLSQQNPIKGQSSSVAITLIGCFLLEVFKVSAMCHPNKIYKTKS